MNKFDKDKSFIWHPFDVFERENILIKKASGIYLHTHDGHKIVDAISSWWVNLHGHRNSFISKAVSKQLRYFEHIIFSGFTHTPAIQLAERLTKILPGNMEKVFFSDDGSTSVEVALKIAFQYWHNTGTPKKKIIAIEGAYHGDTFGSMAVGSRGGFNVPFEPFLFDVEFIPFPSDENKQHIISILEKLTSQNDVAAFIYEPLVQGSAGMRMYDAETLNTLLQIAKKHDVICIADEVMTGFGRTGKNFASEYCEVHPDIICLSKGLTGGYLPMGVTATNQKIFNAFKSDIKSKIFLHGHSYTANPLACAAANASLTLLLSKQCQDSIKRINQTYILLKDKLNALDKVKEVRITGTIMAIELASINVTSYTNPLREVLYNTFIQKDILIRPLGNVIYIMPPYIINDKELKQLINTIIETIKNLN